MNTNVISDIAHVMGIDTPTDASGLLQLVKKANVNQVPQETWEKFSLEAQTYLNSALAAIKEEKQIPLPEDFTPPVEPKQEVEAVNEEVKLTEADQSIEGDEGEAETVPEGIVCKYVSKLYPIKVMLGMLEHGEAKLPDFQRKFIWKTPTQQAFIASILAGVPTPNIMLATDPTSELGERYILDGFQRLSTLEKFYKGQLALGDSLPHLKGKKFNDLSGDLKSKILFTDLVVVEVESPREFWSYVFRQINKGGVTLTPMEIRRATYPHPVVVMLEEITENHRFWEIMFSRNARYRGLAAILRATAMHWIGKEYAKPMDQFIDKFCNYLMKEKLSIDVDDLSKKLDTLLEALNVTFGREAFRSPEGKSANLAVLDCMIHAGLSLLDNNDDLLNDPEALGEKLKDLRMQLFTNSIGLRSVTKDTSSRDNVQKRLVIIEQILNGEELPEPLNDTETVKEEVDAN